MGVYEILIFIGMCILSYLLGGVSIARLITKKESVGGIKTQGSGNPGTMNMLRTHGIVLGLFTLMCDALKGVIPSLFGLLFFSEFCDVKIGYIALYAFGLCAVIGHIYPIYYKFKGGKGIATTFGIFMVADPIGSLIVFGIMFLTLFVIKIGSVVSLLFITIMTTVQLFKLVMDGNWIAIVLMIIMVVLDVYAHRQNLSRLVDNKENPADLQAGIKKDIDRLKSKKKQKEQDEE
ncbi:MAG: glycerol-3-phosphate acyltransferase [Clostridiales bacterium]|nr:glycerol-3-phosphate acyltransferase [Clostridiales bacterium]